MAGNVWEWTSSLYRNDPYQTDDGREDLSGDGTRTLRGGSLYSGDYSVRCAARIGYYPSDGNFVVSFRVVCLGS